MDIELSDYEAENATLQGDYLLKVVEILIGGIPTVFQINFKCLFMSLGRMLLQGSVSTNLFDPVSHHVDHPQVAVGILGFGNNNHVADRI